MVYLFVISLITINQHYNYNLITINYNYYDFILFQSVHNKLKLRRSVLSRHRVYGDNRPLVIYLLYFAVNESLIYNYLLLPGLEVGNTGASMDISICTIYITICIIFFALQLFLLRQ